MPLDKMDSNEETKPSIMHLEGIDFGDSSKELSLWQALRRWPKVSAYCLALTSAILLWGYDMAMNGNLAGLDRFQEDFGQLHDDEWIIASKWLSLWNLASPLGMMFGAIAGGALQDRWGRRLSLALGSLLSTIGVALVFVSCDTGASKQGVFFAGKFIQGLTIGVVVTVTQTYMSEVLPSVLRGPIIAFFPIFFLLGQLISALIVLSMDDVPGRRSYRTCIISMWPFSAIPAVVALFLPESPAHLIRKGKFEAAINTQGRLDTTKDDTQLTIRKLHASIEHEKEVAQSDRSKYTDCFKKTDTRRTCIAMLGAILPQLFGLPILGDGPYFLQIAGMESTDSLIFLVSGIVAGIIGTVISTWLLSFIGRRKLILSTLLPLALLWLGMGIAACFDSPVTAWYVGVTTNLACLTAALGVWPAAYVVTAEVSSLRLRAKTQGIAFAFGGIGNFLFSYITPYIYNADSGNLRSRIGFVWFAICLMTFSGAWYLIPEMLGRTPFQLDLLFEGKVRTRKFSSITRVELAVIESTTTAERMGQA